VRSIAQLVRSIVLVQRFLSVASQGRSIVVALRSNAYALECSDLQLIAPPGAYPLHPKCALPLKTHNFPLATYKTLKT
jgi:hypothetical protein